MANILDMLGLTPYDFDRRKREAIEAAEQDIKDASSSDPAYMFTGQPAKQAPKRVDVDPNIPNKTESSQLGGADYSKFFENLPPIQSDENKLKDFQSNAIEEGGFTDPVTGIRALPTGRPNDFQKDILSSFGRQQEANKERFNKPLHDPSEIAAKKAEYDSLSAQYKALGLTPPPIPKEIESLTASLSSPEKPNEELSKQSPMGTSTSRSLSTSLRLPPAGGGVISPQGAPSGYQSKSLQDMLGSIYGKELGDDSLKEAQGTRDRQQLFANLATAGSQIGAALSRGTVKPELTIQNQLLKQADQPVQDILTRRDAKMKELDAGAKIADLTDKEKLRDPKSDISAAYRNMALQLNPEIGKSPQFNEMNAVSIKELMPMIDAHMRMQAIKIATADKKESKEGEKVDKDLAAFNRGIDLPYTARSGTALGRAANAIRQSEAIQAFAYGGRKLNELTTAQINEIAAGVDQMIRGSSAVGSIKKLVPRNIKMTSSDILSWITSEPQGAGQKGFIELLLKSAEREKTIGELQIKDYQAKFAAQSSRHLADNVEFQNALANRGLVDLYGKAKKGEKIDTATEYLETLKKGPAPVGGPKAGDVEDGHRFKGGNPSDPANWEQVK